MALTAEDIKTIKEVVDGAIGPLRVQMHGGFAEVKDRLRMLERVQVEMLALQQDTVGLRDKHGDHEARISLIEKRLVWYPPKLPKAKRA